MTILDATEVESESGGVDEEPKEELDTVQARVVVPGPHGGKRKR